MLSLSVPPILLYNMGEVEKAMEMAIENIKFLEDQNHKLLESSKELVEGVSQHAEHQCTCARQRSDI